MTKLLLTILGEPVPKGRAKHWFNPKTKQMHGYTTKKTRDAESNLRAQIAQQLPKDFKPFDCALLVVLRFFRSKPKSKPKKDLYPTQKPDLDNLIKTGLDAMNGVVFRDDSLIVKISASKQYSDKPRIELIIEEMFVERISKAKDINTTATQ